MSRLHVIVTTHTTRHLSHCLRALTRQSSPPASVVLSCDVVDSEVDAVVDSLATDFAAAGITLRHVARQHAGVPRVSQVRNNALRALSHAPDDDAVLVIDGDMALLPDCLAVHRRLFTSGKADICLGHRIELDEAATVRLQQGNDAQLETFITAEHARYLGSRARRLRRQLFLRQFGLTKPNKPKLLGAHHAATLAAFRAVNGYDERYENYGFEDDDLARRLYALRPTLSVRIAVDTALAVHLWHPSRAPASPDEAPGAKLYYKGIAGPRAQHGIDNPREQADPIVREVVSAE
ncbi:MAG: glycosyltransferase [Planctomycetota bacterium]